MVDTNGTVYFERNADDAACIASVTKIMTGVVALDAVASGLTSLDSTITVSADAAAVGESSAGLQEGDTMTLKTALYALLVPSGNDAAIAIAESVGAALRSSGTASGDSDVKAFVAQMNATAQKLNCTNTVYENPHGLDFDQYQRQLAFHGCRPGQSGRLRHDQPDVPLGGRRRVLLSRTAGGVLR